MLAERDMTRGVITADEYLEESVPAEPGGTLFVDLDRGGVSIGSHDKNEVRVEAAGRGWASGMCVFTLMCQGRDVQLDGDIDGWFPAFFGGARIQVRVWVPREYSIDVLTRGAVDVEEIGGRVGAQSRGGRIRVRRVAGQVMLRTNGARIGVEEVNGDVRAQSSGGRIDIAYVNGDVEARTSGANIEILGAAGSIDAKTSGGKLVASFLEDPAGRLETSGGSIEVVFPEEACVDLDAKTSGGHVRVEHHMDLHRSKRHHKVGTINGGGLPLRLRTTGGSIRVRAA